jgi:hypothetical protein
MTQTIAKPQIGIGVTECWHSDRKVGTIIEVSPSGHRAKFRYDKTIRTDDNGMSCEQEYRYEPDPSGGIRTIFLANDGMWRIYGGGQRVILDQRNAYHDYEF